MNAHFEVGGCNDVGGWKDGYSGGIGGEKSLDSDRPSHERRYLVDRMMNVTGMVQQLVIKSRSINGRSCTTSGAGELSCPEGRQLLACIRNYNVSAPTRNDGNPSALALNTLCMAT
jgi:hypothetical protein